MAAQKLEVLVRIVLCSWMRLNVWGALMRFDPGSVGKRYAYVLGYVDVDGQEVTIGQLPSLAPGIPLPTLIQ